jgi:4a-hydroxytetrahydrobiopterin dehydratase
MPKLTPAQIKTALAQTPHWTRKGARITRTFVFKDFPKAIAFVNTIAKKAEKAWHHPDIDIRWNKVTLTLTTHDQGGLTEKDFNLALQCDRVGAS